MKLNQAGKNFIKSYEKLSLTRYWDYAGYSIGYGHLIKQGENIGNSITKQKADELFNNDVSIYENIINNAINVKLSQNQFNALVSFAYNTGRTNSTLYDLINRSASEGEIRNFWVSNYITANGVYLSGLKTRRQDEAELFFSGIDNSLIIIIALVISFLILFIIK